MKPHHLLIALALAGTASRAVAAPTDIEARDPSTIIERDGTYYFFATGGGGGRQFSSRDKIHWTPMGAPVPQTPTWLAQAVPGNKDNTVWAPDVAFFGGEYRLYLSYSTLGSNRSAIALATNKTLDPKGWKDAGIVVQSGEQTEFNAIDPSVFRDADGQWWMAFGSYFQGILVTPLDERTGKRAADGALTLIATRPDAPSNPTEGATIYYRDGWYYLFTSWGSIAEGPRSGYEIRVCRSRAPQGPYADKTGRLALQGGGSLFLGSLNDDESGRPYDDQVAPGHAGILREGDSYTLSTTYEWSRFKGGRNAVNVQRLSWDADGWPRAVLDDGPWRIVSRVGTYPVLSAAAATPNLAKAQTQTYEGNAEQKWTLSYVADGYYRVLSAAGGLALGTVGDAATPGASVELAPYRGLDSQQWRARQNEDGTYALMLKAGGGKLALDVPGASLNENTDMKIWKDLHNDAQKWTFHRGLQSARDAQFVPLSAAKETATRP